MFAQVVGKVDHVFVPFDDAQAAFDLFSGELGLPVLYPFDFHGVLRSGAVVLGNIGFEIMQSLPQTAHPLAPPSMTAVVPARVAGLALEPAADTNELLLELDRRELAHTPPHPGPSPEEPVWVNVLLSDLSSERLLVWFYQPNPAALQQYLRERSIPDMFGEAGQAALDAAGGGRLGVRRVDEVVVGMPPIENEAPVWQRLFDPIKPQSPNRWRLGNGPSIRLIPADHRVVDRLVLKVEDVVAAQEAWASLDRAALAGFELGFTN